MKILITGARGQLGQEIETLCRNQPFEFTSCGSRDLDISDTLALRKICNDNRFDCIINCAAYNNVDQAEREWKKAFEINGLGIRNLATVANRIGAILIHFSTDYVFNGKTSRPYTIADHPDPINRYGESKLLGEKFIQQMANRYILIRTSWVFGNSRDNFVQKVLQWSKERNKISVVTDQVSSPTYAEDLASATLSLLTKEMYGTYHVTNSGYCSRFEWASYILQKNGGDCAISGATDKEFPTPARRPHFSVLDNFGFQESCGWNMPDWKDATDRYLQKCNQ